MALGLSDLEFEAHGRLAPAVPSKNHSNPPLGQEKRPRCGFLLSDKHKFDRLLVFLAWRLFG
jgi:hypothetical protein